ncbi:SRC kinase signaling inhibitor 1-like isoform X2 [Stigmatopora nigra]
MINCSQLEGCDETWSRQGFIECGLTSILLCLLYLVSCGKRSRYAAHPRPRTSGKRRTDGEQERPAGAASPPCEHGSGDRHRLGMGNASFPGIDKRRNPMIAAGDVPFRRDYRSDGGSASPSPERRRPAGAPDARQMDGAPSTGGAAWGRQPQANYWSFKSRTPGPARGAGSAPSLSAEHPDDAMSDRDLSAAAAAAFSRTNRLRQSLPLSRSSSGGGGQAKLQAPGVLFLQLGEETRRVHLTHQLSSLETLRALIVHMFPQRLSMATLRSPSTALLIKDESRNVFYELEDPRDVRDRCVIKIYCKEPVYGTYPGPRNSQLANGDLRRREMVYAPQDSPPGRRHGAAPPSSPRGSPSRARLLYGGGGGGRPSSYAGPAPSRHGVSPPRQALFAASSSAILERRDVKPDQEAGGARVAVLPRAEERGAVYAEPYCPESRCPEPRAGFCGSPLPARSDPYGSLYRRGGAMTPCAPLEGAGLYRAGGTFYNDAYAAAAAATPLAVGLRVPAPPSSPQKMGEARDPYGGTLPSRGSPARADRRRDSVCPDGPRVRGLTSEQLCLMAVAAAAGADGLRADETDTRERMEAMEKQIAGLTGLLQRVLGRGPEDNLPEPMESASDGSGTEPGAAERMPTADTPSGPLALMPPPPPPPLSSTPDGRRPDASGGQMRRRLLGLQRSTDALRGQLSQLRSMQLENRDSVLALLRQTEAELGALTLEAAARAQEDPLQRQRLLVEEERLKYLKRQEALVQQLHELEAWVEDLLSSEPAASPPELQIKSRQVQTLADTLAGLKSQFPGLQSKMRVVLRVEVEAVKFLKEEPQRLDALLQRCHNIRQSLGTLRKRVGEKEPRDPGERPPAPTDRHDEPASSAPRAAGEGRPEGRPPTSVDVTLAAERDWEAKRASLTQFSARDIHRLLEETQAELLKALPDLDAAGAKTKPAVPPKPQMAPPGGEPSPGKVQLAAQKLNEAEGGACQRGAADTGVARCRTEKASKSPPPPPPRRSFPSAAKRDSETEDGEPPKAPTKPRRTSCEGPRPASTPPAASGSEPRDADDKEISGGSPASVKGPTVAARLKHLEQGGRKSKDEMRGFPGGRQQVFHF